MKEIWRIVRFTRDLWPYYIGVSIFTIVLAAMNQVQPLIVKGAVDEITKLAGSGHADIQLVTILAALLFLTDVSQTLLSNYGGYIGDMLSIKLQRLMSQRYFKHILSLPQRYFDTQLSGKIINRMNRGIGQVANYVQVVSNNFLQFIFSTVFSLAVVAYFSWQVAVMLGLLYPIFIWLTSRTSTKWQDYQKEINQDIDIASGRFAESIGQVRVVKSFLQEARELKLFSKQYAKAEKTTSPQSKYWHKQDVIRRLVLNVIFFIVFAYIFIETARGTYTIGTMVLLMQYALLIRIPIFSISFIVDQTQRAMANTRDYFEVMDEHPERRDVPGATDLRVKGGEIVFDNVTFAYESGNPVLTDISFRVKPDSKVALVGESGEGKTTITNVLLKMYDIEKGEIYVDGQSLSAVTHDSLRSQIGVVFQEPALFSGTIRENIAYARPKASDKEIIAAAKAANAHEFVSKFEKGYDAEIGERGLRLSGGQKQRIAIARALLKDAPILILDEATSSLDSKSEHMVQEALERLMKGRTTLIIAHRLSTIEHVDQIITLKNGQVDEVGTPKQLSESGGIYAQLLELQRGHTEAGKKKLKQYEISS